MNIEFIDDFPQELDDFALKAESAAFYQTGTWIKSIMKTYPDMKFMCAVAVDNGGVDGYLPFFISSRGPMRIMWSMPFGTYGGPVTSEAKGIGEALVKAYFDYGKSCRKLQTVMVDFKNIYSYKIASAEKCSTQIINLEKGFESVWKDDFDKAKRRQARKGGKADLDVIEAATSEQFDDYFEIYESRMRSWGEKFYYSREFLRELITNGGESVKLYLVRRSGGVIGGHLNFYYRQSVIAWNGMMRSKEHQAGTFLYARLIEDACKKGYQNYNLGGSLEKESLLRYKAGLGGEQYDYRMLVDIGYAGRAAKALKRIIRRG